MNKTQWTPSDTSKSLDIFNRLPVLEFQDNKGEWHNFDLIATPERIVFGGYCNAGFLESGYIERKNFNSLDETLGELLNDLEDYYNGGKEFTVYIVCNERM